MAGGHHQLHHWMALHPGQEGAHVLRLLTLNVPLGLQWPAGGARSFLASARAHAHLCGVLGDDAAFPSGRPRARRGGCGAVAWLGRV